MYIYTYYDVLSGSVELRGTSLGDDGRGRGGRV